MEPAIQKKREILFNEAIESFLSDLKPKLNLEKVEGCDEFLLESLQHKLVTRIEKDIRQSVEALVQECRLIGSLQSLDELCEKPQYQCSWRPSGNPSQDLVSSDVQIYNKGILSINKDSLSRDVSKLQAQIISLRASIQAKN